MRKLSLALALLVAVVGLWSPLAYGATSLTSGNISLTFVISPSPSPTPIAYVPTGGSAQEIIALGLRAQSLVSFDRMVAWEPLRTSDMVAQATNPQGSVKVNFTVKANPNYKYFHIIPGTTTTFNTGYGANTWTCAYQVYASYSGYSWNVTDWVYNTNSTGGVAGFNGFPTYNYPTTSLLQWLAETQTSTFTPFANDGSPGQSSFSGASGTTKTICIDLSLNVPASIAAGSYQTTIQYNMMLNL